MYQIAVPNMKRNQAEHEHFETVKIRLSLSGGQLIVKTGGGFQLFLEWLHNKKILF